MCPKCREKKEREGSSGSGEKDPSSSLPPPQPPMTLADFVEASVGATERALGILSRSSSGGDDDRDGESKASAAAALAAAALAAAAAAAAGGNGHDGAGKPGGSENSRGAAVAAGTQPAATLREVEALFWETVEEGDRPVDVLSAFGVAMPPGLPAPSLSLIHI